MIRKIAHLLLRCLSPTQKIKLLRDFRSNLEMLLAAIGGRGGGSGWDSKGQVRAIANCTQHRPGMVVLDVGANNGNWSAELYLELKNSSPQFHLFECAPYCFEPLQKAVAGFNSAKIVKKAVSDSEGEIILNVPKVGSGLASVYERNDTSVRKHEYEKIRVPTTTLDRYILENNLGAVDLLKVDVEGHELSVFGGARKAFENRIIGNVMFEFGSANLNSRTYFKDFWEFFDGYGYQLLRVAPGGVLIPLVEYNDDMEYFRGCSNFIATRRF